jgi:hypothetical protein
MRAQPKDVVQGKQNSPNPDSQSVTDLGRHSTDKRISNRNSRPRVVTEKIGETVRSLLPHESLPGLERAFGTNDRNAITALLEEVKATLPRANQDPLHWNFLLATLHDIGPKDTIEGLLAVQMVSVHVLAMEFLARAMRPGQSFEETDATVNRANKLLRTFTAQVESLNHHRGKALQPMVVGNVNVADGGQAIVGSVNHPGPGKVSKDNEKKKVG